jgi:hypothetical protein
VAVVEEEVTVEFYGAQLSIRDIDSALGYIFSVCPLPKDATVQTAYLPLLAVYCKFMQLMVFDGATKFPFVACAAIGTPPLCGGVKTIAFGATLRAKAGQAKETIRKFRKAQLEKGYHKELPPEQEPQKYGHCAETYPYLCFLSQYVSRTF